MDLPTMEREENRRAILRGLVSRFNQGDIGSELLLSQAEFYTTAVDKKNILEFALIQEWLANKSQSLVGYLLNKFMDGKIDRNLFLNLSSTFAEDKLLRVIRDKIRELDRKIINQLVDSYIKGEINVTKLLALADGKCFPDDFDRILDWLEKRPDTRIPA